MCNKFTEGKDIQGPNLPGTKTTASDQDCLKLCQNTPTCNASVRVPNGKCYMKNVNLNAVATRDVAFTSYLICPSPLCDKTLVNTDIMGDDLTSATTESDQECINLCANTASCNAIVRIPGGDCFMRSVDLDNVQHFTVADYTSYLDCSGIGGDNGGGNEGDVSSSSDTWTELKRLPTQLGAYFSN